MPSVDDYTPPFTITDTMLQHIAIISEKLGKVNIDEGLKKSLICVKSVVLSPFMLPVV